MLHLPPFVATVLCFLGIGGLFVIGRQPEIRTSKALWIPTLYFLVIGSRPVSFWLGMAPKGSLPSVYIEGSPVDRLVYIAFLLAGLAVVLCRMDQVGSLLQANVPILLYFSFAALSILWSDYSFITFKHWTKGITDIVMVLVVVTEADPVGAIQRVLVMAGFTLMPLSVLLCKYYPALGRVMTASWKWSYAGVTMGKNELGGLCLVVGLGFLWIWSRAYRDRQNPRRRYRLCAFGAVILMALLLLKMCDSLTSIGCFFIAGAIMWLATQRRVRYHPSFVHLLTFGLIGATAFILFITPSLVVLLGRTPTLHGRTLIWHGVLSVPDNRLVGAGYESFFLGNRLEAFWSFPGCKRIQEAHDGYLEVYVNLGWIGVSMLALLLAAGYRKIIAAYRQAPEIFSLNLAFFASALIHNFTEGQFRMQTLTWVSLLWAIISASAPISTSQRAPEPVEWNDRGESLSELEPALESGHSGWQFPAGRGHSFC